MPLTVLYYPLVRRRRSEGHGDKDHGGRMTQSGYEHYRLFLKDLGEWYMAISSQDGIHDWDEKFADAMKCGWNASCPEVACRCLFGSTVTSKHSPAVAFHRHPDIIEDANACNCLDSTRVLFFSLIEQYINRPSEGPIFPTTTFSSCRSYQRRPHPILGT